MGSSSSKDAASSSSDRIPGGRFKRARVLQYACLGGHSDSSEDDEQVSGPEIKESGRLKNETCTDQRGIKPDIVNRGCCGKLRIHRSNRLPSVSSYGEVDGFSQERGIHIDSSAGSSSSQKVVSGSSSRLSRSLSRFNFIPDNISVRLSRAASLGSSCSYSFFSTSLLPSNSGEGLHGQINTDLSDIRNESHPSSSNLELPCTNLSSAPQCHDPTSEALQVGLPMSAHPPDEITVSSQDVARNNSSMRPESAVNGHFQRCQSEVSNVETRRSDRRAGAQEPVEGSIRFSRTLSVGRLRDRVLRRTSFPEGLFRHLHEDRVVGDRDTNGGRLGGDGTRMEISDGNTDTLPSSSNHNLASTSTSINDRQGYEVEGPQPREASSHALVESRTAFLERRRRIRSQVRALQRLGSRFENLSGHDRECILSGQHRTGRCTCRANARSINPDEDTSTRASISRIVMLAEALFEVLDEIHQQSVVLSSRPSVSSIGSVPAPREVVESMPVKIYAKPHKNQNDEAAQCYICLVEYDEGDCVRVLPCHHDFHQTCVDKWLKEIHRVCPLCRGDVCRSDLSHLAKVS